MNPLHLALQAAERIFLVSHLQPDGDAIGSLFGLQLALEKQGKHCTSFLPEPVPKAFSFLDTPSLSHRQTSPSSQEYDLIIVLDAPDAARTGIPQVLKTAAKEQKLVLIDHHPKGDLLRLATHHLRDEMVSSTAELVYRLLGELSITLTPAIASCLLTGIYTDTGGFQHPNTTVSTLEVSADLMRKGARLNRIAQQIAQTKSLASLRLLGIALERLQISQDGSWSISVLTHADLQDCQASSQDLTGLINELNVLPGVQVCLLLVEAAPGLIRGTLRSGLSSKTKVSRLATLLGGGGHPRAAGFSLVGRLVLQPKGKWQILPSSSAVQPVAEPEKKG